MTEPTNLRINTTASWVRSIDDYSADDGWSASYVLNAAGLSTITISTTGSGNDFTVDVKPSTTSTWAAGTYAWYLKVSDGTDTYEVDTGTIEILAENATGNDLLDARSYLDDAETELQARVSGKASSYAIKDRSLTRASVEDLMKIVTYWRKRVNSLEDAERRRKGKTSNRITYARFR